MPFGQVVIGPPGSGKTTYCHGMQQFLTATNRKVAIINLDPANDRVPYECTVDLADLVALDQVQEQLGLGPNGGLVYCMEHLAANMDWLRERLDALTAQHIDYFIFDCPGQAELYNMHNAVQHIIVATLQNEWGYRLTAVHLVDSHLCSDAAKYISALMLALSTMLHLEMPFVNVLSKIDMMEQYGNLAYNLEFYLELQDLSRLPDLLEQDPALRRYRSMAAKICEVVDDFSLVSFVPLAIEDKEIVQHVLALVDSANGYAYAGLRRNADEMPAEVVYGRGLTSVDTSDLWTLVKEKYLLPDPQEHDVSTPE